MHTIRVRDFNTQLHKWTEYPGNTNLKWHIKWHRSDLNVYRTFHLKASKCALFPSTHGTFSRIDHILGHKPHLDKNSPGCGLSTLLSWNPPQKKGHIWQTHRKHHSQWWKFESISSKVRNKTRVPTLTTTIRHSFGSFTNSNQGRNRNKRNPYWKRSSKTLIVCRWHDSLHRKP